MLLPMYLAKRADAEEEYRQWREQAEKEYAAARDASIWDTLLRVGGIGLAGGAAAGGAHMLYRYLKRPDDPIEYFRHSTVGGRLRSEDKDDFLELPAEKKKKRSYSKYAGVARRDVSDLLGWFTSNLFPADRLNDPQRALHSLAKAPLHTDIEAGINFLGEHPWTVPAAAVLAGGGAYTGYSLARLLADTRKRDTGAAEKERAKKKFEEALAQQYAAKTASTPLPDESSPDETLPDLSPLDDAFDVWQSSQKQAVAENSTLGYLAGWPFGAASVAATGLKNILPLYLAYASVAGPWAAWRGYSNNDTSKQQEEAIKATIRRRAAIEALKSPPEIHFRVRRDKKKDKASSDDASSEAT